MPEREEEEPLIYIHPSLARMTPQSSTAMSVETEFESEMLSALWKWRIRLVSSRATTLCRNFFDHRVPLSFFRQRPPYNNYSMNYCCTLLIRHN